MSLLYILPAVVIAAAVYASMKKFKSSGSGKKAVYMNLTVFSVLLVVVVASAMTATAAPVSPADIATTSAPVTTAAAVDPTKGLGMIAAALVTGLSGIGGGIAVAAAAPAAIGATSENEKIFGKALIFVALGETIALYGLIISIMILGEY
ncbi:MAG: ATP synthase subunit C [Oscillospiraceae bacterium]|jgi:V/A-type H+-transporting ATPase subunit K|nr:ATP synthase subunit C [Oscillospiraceae bacterium]